jgi:hypothetical protein
VNINRKQQIRAYERKLKQLRRQADRLPKDAIRRALELLKDTRIRIVSTVAATEWKLAYLGDLRSEIDRLIAEFIRRYSDEMLILTEEGFDLGIALVDEPLADAGIYKAMPALSRTQLEIMQGFTVDLITDIGDDTRKRILTSIQLGLLGEKPQNKVIREIGRNLTSPSVFKTIADRAETISRTETMRVLNLTHQARLDRVAKHAPELKKYWIATRDSRTRPSHAAVAQATNPDWGGTPIPLKDKFVIGGHKADGPHDPGLPAAESINCRCTIGTILE